MTVPHEKASANSVPAAAVRQKMQALLGITGRKGSAGDLSRLGLKHVAQRRVCPANEQDRAIQRYLECCV